MNTYTNVEFGQTTGKFTNNPECPIIIEGSRKYLGTQGKDMLLQIMRFTNIYLGANVRAIVVYNTVYLCYNDLCNALDVKNHSDQVKERLDREDQIIKNDKSSLLNPYIRDLEEPYMYFNIESEGGKGSTRYLDTLFISEASFYKTLFRSNSPKAILFTHWVAHDVLPVLRNIGCTQMTTNMILSNLQFMIDAACRERKASSQQIKSMLEYQNDFLQKDYLNMRNTTIDATGRANYMKGVADQFAWENQNLKSGIAADVGAIAYNSAAAATYYGNMQQQQKQPYPNPDIVADQY